VIDFYYDYNYSESLTELVWIFVSDVRKSVQSCCILFHLSVSVNHYRDATVSCWTCNPIPTAAYIGRPRFMTSQHAPVPAINIGRSLL